MLPNWLKIKFLLGNYCSLSLKFLLCDSWLRLSSDISYHAWKLRGSNLIIRFLLEQLLLNNCKYSSYSILYLNLFTNTSKRPSGHDSLLPLGCTLLITVYHRLVYTKTVDSVKRARWLARQTPNILCYLPPSDSRENGVPVCGRDKWRNHPN